MDKSEIKKMLGFESAKMIQNNMTVGLGTGSTAYFFIESLAKRCQEGLNIKAVSSSNSSTELAKKFNIPLVDINNVTHVDITVDGADQVDKDKNLIKGLGGALLREKIVAANSKKIVIIIDSDKYVDNLGNYLLPVEVTPYGFERTRKKLKEAGYEGTFRNNKDGSIYLTDNNNYIIDLKFNKKIMDPKQDHYNILNIIGVIETGFFFDLPMQIMIGNSSKNIELK